MMHGDESHASGKTGGWASLGVVAALAILVSAVAYKTQRTLTAYYHAHPFAAVSIIVVVLLAAALLLIAWCWNRYVDLCEERAITAEEPTAVCLGLDATRRPVYLKQRFRTMHTEVIGTTSAGKTESVVLPWAIHDIETGAGLLIVDGKSDHSFLTKLHAYVVRSGRQKDFRLFSLANLGPSSTFNPLLGGGPLEVVERVFSSYVSTNEYYRNAQYQAFLLMVRLIHARGEVPTFALVHRLIRDSALIQNWSAELKDEGLRYELARFGQEPERERNERLSGLETFLARFACGELSSLFNPVEPGIQLDEVLRKNLLCYFQLPSMFYPELAKATGKLVLQAFQSAVARRHLGLGGDAGFFACYLDDFQDYIYEGFGALLNKSRSANVGVVFSHQALGDLEKVSPAFRNVVLSNTNVKVVMRNNDPDTADYLARSFGTEASEKKTERRQMTILGEMNTGEGSVRDVEQYVVHPNVIRGLGIGRGFVSIPHERGVKIVEIAFERRPDLEPVPLPDIPKTAPSFAGFPARPSEEPSRPKDTINAKEQA